MSKHKFIGGTVLCAAAGLTLCGEASARLDISGETARQTVIAEVGRTDWHVAPEEAKAVAEWMTETAQRPVDSNEVAVANPPRDMKLFLLVGQSNMAGRGTVSEEDRKAPPRCLKLNRDGVWIAATSPIHFDRRTAGYGIADTFVRRYLEEHPNDTVGLIPCAVGGSMSATWSPEDRVPDPIGSNYRFALNRARLAQKNGRIAGILWHQGEADRWFVREQKGRGRYIARLAALAAALRRALGCSNAPFLIGEIGTLPVDCTVMNPVLAAAADIIPNCKLVKASDLTGHLPDGVHFDTPSYKILGARYYEAWKTVALAREADATALPPLVGDGFADDTAAIQARLDAGACCVYLPPPKDHYVISKTLQIGSNQTLRLDPSTRIRLAPQSNCPMLVNRGWKKGDADIVLSGGIWDMDNRSQRHNVNGVWQSDPAVRRKYLTPEQDALQQKIRWPDPYERDFFRGNAFYFENVRHLVATNFTIRNPTTYGFQMCKVSNFLIADVTLDFSTWNPVKANMDGIHLDGFCHHGVIRNIRGTAYDDCVALNANDGRCAAYQGPITDVVVDGIYADYSHSAVRLLSTGAEIRRIDIGNIHGNFYRYCVGFTHFFPSRGRGTIDDVRVHDCRVGKCPQPEDLFRLDPQLPLFYFDDKLDVANVTFENVVREERSIANPMFEVRPTCRIKGLNMKNVTQEIHTREQPVLMDNRGTIEERQSL